MNKATKPFETVFIFFTPIPIKNNDNNMVIFSKDSYSNYVFPPLINKMPRTDNELDNLIETVIKNVLNQYNPEIHSKTITFVTNFIEESESSFKKVFGDNHKIIFNEKMTEKALKPFMKGLQNYI